MGREERDRHRPKARKSVFDHLGCQLESFLPLCWVANQGRVVSQRCIYPAQTPINKHNDLSNIPLCSKTNKLSACPCTEGTARSPVPLTGWGTGYVQAPGHFSLPINPCRCLEKRFPHCTDRRRKTVFQTASIPPVRGKPRVRGAGGWAAPTPVGPATFGAAGGTGLPAAISYSLTSISIPGLRRRRKKSHSIPAGNY